MASLYDQNITATTISGEELHLDDLAGKVVLIVNTASKCGFTPQFEALEALYQRYKGDSFVVIGFPCNQFAHQDPGTDQEISEGCRVNYGVTFPMMSKIDVNGANQHPLYSFLTSQQKGVFGGLLGGRIMWNFTKFLVGKDGVVLNRYAPSTAPESLEEDIRAALSRPSTM